LQKKPPFPEKFQYTLRRDRNMADMGCMKKPLERKLSAWGKGEKTVRKDWLFWSKPYQKRSEWPSRKGHEKKKRGSYCLKACSLFKRRLIYCDGPNFLGKGGEKNVVP